VLSFTDKIWCVGFTTITSTALLFAKTTLSMSPGSLILIGVLTPVSGILGSLLWPRVQRRFKWSNLRILVTLVILASLIPAYGCLGFLPVFKRENEFGVTSVTFGGLTSPNEMYVLAVYFGKLSPLFLVCSKLHPTFLAKPSPFICAQQIPHSLFALQLFV
jgi:UMF1 family MFS transporter